MATASVKKPTEKELKELGVDSWGIWEKEESTFPHSYDEKETCYILEGEAEVKSKDESTISFRPGDLVTFPQGLECTWTIKKRIKKRYRFG